MNSFYFTWLLLQKLVNVGLLTPPGLFHFARAVGGEGVNLMTLLGAANRIHRQKTALVDERETLSYADLYSQARNLAAVLQTRYELRTGQKTAIICRNHASLLRAMFAVSRLGADIYFLNPEITAAQFEDLAARYSFNLVIYDTDAEKLIAAAGFKNTALPAYHETLDSIAGLSQIAAPPSFKLKKSFAGNIVVLTGGTTGKPKTARRKPSLFNFLNPFCALLVKLDLDKHRTAYVATPAYHGFGLATVFMSLMLGVRMHFIARFDAAKGCRLVAENNLEIVTLVPLMLQRMMNHDQTALKSLRCIVSGGAPLNPALVEETFEKLGDKLFNLYGTSEAGFSIMATPADLRRDSRTVGKKISGVKLKILDAENREVTAETIGRVCLKSRWSISDGGKNWIETGDLGWRDASGLLFLCGRNDEMIVSAGEKVYPVELETILSRHPEIESVAVIGIADTEFGQRLKAFVVPRAAGKLDEAAILAWLTTRAARFQMPKSIVLLSELPVTALGKPNKKALI